MTVTWTWEADPAPATIDPKVMRKLRARIDDILQREKDRHIELLCDLLRFPTVSGGVDPEADIAYRTAMARCLGRVRSEAESLGMDWRSHGGIVAVAEWPGRNREGSIGVASHLDVVPAGDGWKHPPFGAEIHDDAVWGRGAQDDKGPAAMSLSALRVLRALGLHPDKDIRLMFGTLEETEDWPDMDLLLVKERAPELVLVPDGAFPVIVGEKGIMTIEWRASYAPPTGIDGLRFVAFEGGTRPNVVPEHAALLIACDGDVEAGRRTLEALPESSEIAYEPNPPPSAQGAPCFRVLFEGRPCHAAFPHDGDNAILKGLRALTVLLPNDGIGAFVRMLTDHCTDLDGTALGLHRAHERLGDSTVNIGTASLSPTSGSVSINVRFPLGLRVDDVQTAFREAGRTCGPGARVDTTTHGRPQNPIYLSPEDHPRLIHTLQAAYQIGTGREPHLATLAGTTYAKVFPLALAFGPQDTSSGEPILAHQPNERITIERHLENIRVYALALAMLACDPEEIARVVDGR